MADENNSERPNRSVLLLGADATESKFKSEPLANFKILHFAVHGLSNPQFPDRAALILGRDPKSNDGGLLQFREIAQLSFTLRTAKIKQPRSGKRNSIMCYGSVIAHPPTGLLLLWSETVPVRSFSDGWLQSLSRLRASISSPHGSGHRLHRRSLAANAGNTAYERSGQALPIQRELAITDRLN